RLSIYPCLRDGYSESTATSVELQPDVWQRHTLPLPQGSGFGPIRLDPSDCVCIVELTHLAVRRAADAAMLAEWAGPALAELRPGDGVLPIPGDPPARFLSTGADPQLYLPPLAPTISDQPLLIEVWIRIQVELRTLGPLLSPGPAELAQAEAALKASREQAAGIASQLDEALSQNRLLQAEVLDARAEVRSHQAERLALIAERRYYEGFPEGRQDEKKEESELREKQNLEGRLGAEQAARLEWTAKYEGEREQREALLNSYSWRITGPLRRLCDLGYRIWRPR
ncbi:MAG TPA: hypothetical protein VH639_06115, partial [Bryobacteraceae bacterium]